MKCCVACAGFKHLEEFYTSKVTKDGYESSCKDCFKSRAKKRYEANRETMQESFRLRYYSQREAVLAQRKVSYRADPNKAKSRAAKRKASKKTATVETVFISVVFERDAWICQLCHTPVDQALQYPHPYSRSLDHIVPLSKGGHHSYANTQLAHLVCNMRKGSKLSFIF